jgi:hypothetical protein
MGRLGFYGRYAGALNRDLGICRSYLQRDVRARLLPHFQLYAFGLVLLESRRHHDQVIRAARHGAKQVVSALAGLARPTNAALGTAQRDLCIGDRRRWNRSPYR